MANIYFRAATMIFCLIILLTFIIPSFIHSGETILEVAGFILLNASIPLSFYVGKKIYNDSNDLNRANCKKCRYLKLSLLKKSECYLNNDEFPDSAHICIDYFPML